MLTNGGQYFTPPPLLYKYVNFHKKKHKNLFHKNLYVIQNPNKIQQRVNSKLVCFFLKSDGLSVHGGVDIIKIIYQSHLSRHSEFPCNRLSHTL